MEKIINIEINDLKYLYSQLSLAIDCLHTDIKNLEEELEILLQYWKGEAQKIFINNLKNEPKEKTIKRINLTLNNGHHSVYDHIMINLNIQNIPKILAISLPLNK